jgi:predicted DsbA family dithiol-disulfide isomerase
LREAYARGLTGVPAFDIGGRMLVGLQSKERLEEAIDEASRRP